MEKDEQQQNMQAPQMPQQQGGGMENYQFLNNQESINIDDVNAYFISDAQMALNAAKSAKIKQKVELLEVFTGCETKNRYNVILNFPNGTNAFLFKAKEESDCCSRNCVHPSDRPLNMKIKYIRQPNQFNGLTYDDCDYNFEKPCTCSCFCLSR